MLNGDVAGKIYLGLSRLSDNVFDIAGVQELSPILTVYRIQCSHLGVQSLGCAVTKGWACSEARLGSGGPMAVQESGGHFSWAGSQARWEPWKLTPSWATGMVLWLCLLTHLPKATGSPCAPSNSGDFRGLGLFSCARRSGGLSFLPMLEGHGAEPETGPAGSSSLSCCPSGLQHNRIWRIGADTFSQLSSLQAL